LCSSRIVKGGKDIPTEKPGMVFVIDGDTGGADISASEPNFEKTKQPPSAPHVSLADEGSDGVGEDTVIPVSPRGDSVGEDLVISVPPRRDSMEVMELGKFRPSSAQSVIQAAEASRSDIDTHMKNLSINGAITKAEEKLESVFDAIMETDVNREQLAQFEKLTFVTQERIVQAIDVNCSPEEFRAQMSKVAMVREECEKERKASIDHYRAEMEGRVATISHATDAWRLECEKTAKTVMDLFVLKVEKLVKAEGLVMDHQFRQHQLMVEARAAEFNQHMNEEERTLAFKKATVETKLDLERKANENANAQMLQADEVKKQTETTKLDLEDLKAKKDHDKELRALNRQSEKDEMEAKKRRAKDEDDHKKRLMEVEKQKKQDERDHEKQVKKIEEERKKQDKEHEKQVKEIEKQKQKDAAEIEKQKQKDAAEIEKQRKKQEKEAAEEAKRNEIAIKKEQMREEAAHQKAKLAQEREAQKEKDKLDKLKSKQQLDASTHEMLVKELKEQNESYKLEYDLAREAMQNAIAQGRKCTMSQNPPCIDLAATKVIRGWVKWELQ